MTYRRRWFIGLKFARDQVPQGQSINLTDDIQRFQDMINMINRQDRNNRNRNITTEYCKKKDLISYLPEDKKHVVTQGKKKRTKNPNLLKNNQNHANKLKLQQQQLQQQQNHNSNSPSRLAGPSSNSVNGNNPQNNSNSQTNNHNNSYDNNNNNSSSSNNPSATGDQPASSQGEITKNPEKHKPIDGNNHDHVSKSKRPKLNNDH